MTRNITPRTYTPTGALPHELTSRDQWIVWKSVPQKNGKPRKVPCTPQGGALGEWSTNRAKWLTHEQAEQAYRDNKNLAGIGFVLTPNDPIVFVDLDSATDGKGTPQDWAQEHLDDFSGTYSEVSPSKDGYHILAIGELPQGAPHSAGNREVYEQGRWMTVTGVAHHDREITAQPEALGRYLQAMKPQGDTPTTPTAAPGATFTEGGRDNALTSLAGTMRRAGLSQAEIEGALAVANVQRCNPPLDTKDVLRIAQSVARYEPAFDATAQMVPMERVDVAGVITDPSPPPRFVWEGLCPRGEVTLLAAHGGVGKSTIALMLAVSVATGRALFGKTVEQGAALFVSLEDPGAIVRHRLKRICEAWAIDPATLATQLHIVDGTDNPELFTADKRDGGHTTHVYDELHELCGDTNPAIVIIDNASDAYGGDEIQRRQVRAFIRTLKTLGKEHDAGVMLLSHVDKNTSRANKSEGDEGYSGSTAWNNTVRSRLFMTRESGVMLKLQHQKGNLSARMEEPIMLRWLENQLPEASSATMRQQDEHAAQELLAAEDARVILGYMQKAIDAGEELNPGRTGAHTAPTKLEPYGLNPEFRGKEGRLRFWRAFDWLFRHGHIVSEQYKANYKDRTRIVIVEPVPPSANDDDENDALADCPF